MSYELIAQCIRSGQCSPAQVAQHLANPHFAAWYRKNYPLQQ